VLNFVTHGCIEGGKEEERFYRKVETIASWVEGILRESQGPCK